VSAFDLSPEEKTQLAAKWWHSPVEFCRSALPDWFPTKMPWLHRGILALRFRRTDFLLDFGEEVWRDEEASWTPADLDKVLTNFVEEGSGKPIFVLHEDPSKSSGFRIDIEAQDFLALIIPRGFSKTTLMNAANLLEIEYKSEDFFLYVSEASEHAKKQLGTVKAELEDHDGDPENPLLNSVFGKRKPDRNSPLKWTEEFIETLNGVMVGAVGRGGQVRGFGKRAKRPGVIVADDIEDEDSVRVDTQREQASSWFFRTLLPARKDPGGRIFVIGTLLHTDAILNKCIKSRRFTAVRFGAIDRQGDAVWPYKMDLAAVEQLKQDMAAEGELAGFYLEYMSAVFDDGAKKFPESKLVYVHKGAELFVGMALAMDPAIGEDRRNDFAAQAVVGTEKNGHKHVLDVWAAKGVSPDDQIDKFFELHFAWMAHLPPEYQKHGIEAIAFQRALISLVKDQQFRRSRTMGMNAYFEVEPIFHGRVAKQVRVESVLKKLIWSGHFTFQDSFTDPLAKGITHSQFVDWPNGKKDCPDAIAMAVRLLDPMAALALGDDGMDDLLRDKAPPLSVVLGGRFGGAP
jgi:hypothetical protein